jgi:hypothetical protein
MLPIAHFRRLVKRLHRAYKYADTADTLDSLSQPVFPWDAISDISDQTGIPTQTLADWHKHRTNPEIYDWAPSSPALDEAIAP